MGLRDRGFILDFYIPLFSGVDAAQRGRFNLKFPASSYNPYIDNGGSGSPGGLGVGGGGFSDPIDNAIATPSVTSPALLASDVCPTDSIVASDFDASDGQTHIASRWWIEAVNPDDVTAGAGIFVADSGPDSTHLTQFPLTGLGLAPGSTYAVYVRYQGSSGTWSDASLHSVFTMQVCGVCGEIFGGSDSTTFIIDQGGTYETACDIVTNDNAEFLAAYNAANGGGWSIATGFPTVPFNGVPAKIKLVKTVASVDTFSAEYDYTSCCFQYGSLGGNTEQLGITRQISLNTAIADFLAINPGYSAEQTILTSTGGDFGFGQYAYRYWQTTYGTYATTPPCCRAVRPTGSFTRAAC